MDGKNPVVTKPIDITQTIVCYLQTEHQVNEFINPYVRVMAATTVCCASHLYV